MKSYTQFETKDTYPTLLSAKLVFREKSLVGIELEYEKNIKEFFRKSNGCNVLTDKKTLTIKNDAMSLFPGDSPYEVYKIEPATKKYFSSVQRLSNEQDNSEGAFKSSPIEADQLLGVLSLLKGNHLLAPEDQAFLTEMADIKKIEEKIKAETTIDEPTTPKKI